MTNEILKMDNVRIVFRNFAGRASQFNREGDREFSVVIDDVDVANALVEDGWNVHIKAPREEGDKPFCFLKVKVKFSRVNPRLNPKIYLKSGRNLNTLDEETVNMLDGIDIANVDLDIRPYHYDVKGEQGVSAYLQSICVTQEVDRFQQRFAEEEYPVE